MVMDAAMTLVIIAFLAGVLTIISPCILPVLPFVLARADRPFLRSGLPLLVGLALSFAVAAALTSLSGGWLVQVSQYGRAAALALLAVFALSLLLPGLAQALMQPLVSVGDRLLARKAGMQQASSLQSSLVVGMATGLLWTPCAGPVLGLVLTGAALGGPGTRGALLLAYAAGAATSLAVALLAGRRLLAWLKGALPLGEWFRKFAGGVALVSVAAMALGVDTGALAQLSADNTTALEQRLLDRVQPPSVAGRPAAAGLQLPRLPVLPLQPRLDGATQWLNSPPLDMAALRGKVVLVNFWTYSCINCLRTLPYLRAWNERYASQGLVVVGVHAPEFAFEKIPANVRRAVMDLQLGYPVALDNDFAIWRGFDNQYWPALYFIDAQGRLRHRQFGEGGHEQSERALQQLLAEAGAAVPGATVHAPVLPVQQMGVGLAPDPDNLRTPETYLGYRKAGASPVGGFVPERRHDYRMGKDLRLNAWGLSGDWLAKPEHTELAGGNGALVLRFHARDLHLVMGPSADGKPVPFVLTLDGQPPGVDKGVDVDASGRGQVSGERLYQLVRQQGAVKDRTVEIRFLAPGARVFAFTFG